jgi:hypothetical protein
VFYEGSSRFLSLDDIVFVDPDDQLLVPRAGVPKLQGQATTHGFTATI